jgi:inorganic triphosphatase YgiF
VSVTAATPESESGSEVEVEVKLAVDDPVAVRDLIEVADPERLAGFEASGAVRESRLLDRYLDTADGRLAAAGARARIRTGHGPARLALKYHGVDDGAVTSRREIEGPATDALDPAEWPDSAARRELLRLKGADDLVEIARLRQHRVARDMERDDARVELSLDALEALDGDRVVATRWELEAELKRGQPGPLHELAAALQSAGGTGPPTGAKLAFAIGAVAAARVLRALSPEAEG